MTQVRLSLRRRLRFRMEKILFDLAAGLLPILPRAAILSFAHMAGHLAWHVARRDRRIALANLELAYGQTISYKEKKRIVRRVFTTFAQTGFDYFWFSRDRNKRLQEWVVVEESVKKWMKKGALVAVTAHYGNWEVLGWMTVLNGSLIASVAKPVKNPIIDQRINELRTQSGQLIIPRDGAIRSLVKVLRQEGTVALLLDQDTLPAEGGVFVPFFGFPVPVATAAAGLALKLKVPILMAFCTSDRRGVYHCSSPAVLLPDEIAGLSAETVTARVTEILESQIRRDPGCWLWTYKRWKRRLPGSEGLQYPFYADC